MSEKEAQWQVLDRATATRKRLMRAGYLPLPATGKAIPLPGWTDIRATDALIDRWSTQFPDALSTGCLTRETPVIDIDITDAVAADAVEALAREIFEERGHILIRFGSAPKRAIPLRTTAPFSKQKLALVTPNGGSAEIEILASGQQFIVAGEHPDTRKPYSWHGAELWTVPHEALPHIDEQQARGFLMAAERLLVEEFDYKPVSAPNGHDSGAAAADTLFDEIYGGHDAADYGELIKRIRAGVELHDSLLALSMSLIGGGASESATVRLLEAEMRQSSAPRDARWQERFNEIPRLVAGAARKRGADATSSNVGHSWDEPDVSVLDDRRGDLPEFPLDAIPSDAQDWISRAARGAGVSNAHVAVPLLGIVSGLLGTARRVRASKSFSQPCAMWAAIVGASGTGKTPGMDTVKRAVAFVDGLKRSSITEQQSAHTAKVEAAKAARALWKKAVEDAACAPVVDLTAFRGVKSTPPLPLEAIIPPPFVAPRLFVTDSTIERLAVLLTARPRGMLLIGDELAGLFLNMGRYSNGSDREFWLEAWNGGSYVVERMSRDPIMVDHLLVGLVGGLQPDKLARSFSGDLDGLYARVLFSWPDEPAYRPLSDDTGEVEPEITNALARLVDLDDGGKEAFVPFPVSLTTDAVARFEVFRRLAHDEKQALDDGRERDWISKAQAHVLRLAITLEYVAWGFRGGDEPRHVSEASIAAAVRLVHQYFWPHARAALRQIGLSGRHANARRVLRWLAATRPAEFSREDIRVLALGRTLDAEQAQATIDILTKAGWCREVVLKSSMGGRPARRWTANPRLWGSS